MPGRKREKFRIKIFDENCEFHSGVFAREIINI